MGKIGFTGNLAEGQLTEAPTVEDHAVYNDRPQYTAGELSQTHIGRIIRFDYDDGTSESVKVIKITHYTNGPGKDRGTTIYEEGTPMTQLIISRNGDTRAIALRSADEVKL